jgi:hypothetical protein
MLWLFALLLTVALLSVAFRNGLPACVDLLPPRQAALTAVQDVAGPRLYRQARSADLLHCSLRVGFVWHCAGAASWLNEAAGFFLDFLSQRFRPAAVLAEEGR